jgi:6-phosphogluconate dehydrogenase
MTDPRSVRLSQLRAALGRALDLTEARLGAEVTLDVEYYWHLPAEDAFDMAKTPDEFTVGQVSATEGEFGWVHAGQVGAGHFSKMVHNGIEYAIMQAYGEGWELLQKVGEVDNVTEVFRSWREGTVIRSWLLDLLVAALDDDEGLSHIRGYAEDSGEGRWTVEAAIDNAVPMPAITGALFARFASRQDDSPTMKAVSAMRNQFGGHATKVSGPPTTADKA